MVLPEHITVLKHMTPSHLLRSPPTKRAASPAKAVGSGQEHMEQAEQVWPLTGGQPVRGRAKLQDVLPCTRKPIGADPLPDAKASTRELRGLEAQIPTRRKLKSLGLSPEAAGGEGLPDL